MITGAQISEARALLGWSRSTLARRAKLNLSAMIRAEGAGAAAPPITLAQAAAVQRALEAAGVEFTNGNEPGVKLRAR